MTSESEAYVWIWLPGESSPVVAGRLSTLGPELVFNYGQSYLARNTAIAIYDRELPLEPGLHRPLTGLSMPSCIRDASPDAWGRRVLINRKLGKKGKDAELDELTYLLESGSDRVGALDFQRSPAAYVPRSGAQASLAELQLSAQRIDEGLPLRPDLDQALQHGSSLGGARPKVMLEDDDRKFIAKFSSASDLYNVVKAEFIAMRLAARAGLNVAPVELRRALGKDVLLIQRFDRSKVGDVWQRRAMVSALTLLELDEMMARYASYPALAEIVRHRFSQPKNTMRELFARIVFNVLCGNTDDHARNHAAFWDGQHLDLTPAYDICPQARTGNEASQAMLISEDNRMSQIAACLEAAPQFQLGVKDATEIVAHQVVTIRDQWSAVCDEAELSIVDRQVLWQRQFLNPFAFEQAPAELSALVS